METLLRTLLSNDLIRARVKNGIAAASVAVGAWTLSHLYDWSMAHLTFFSSSDNMAIAGTVASAVAALVLTIGTAVYTSIVDPKTVDAKITIAAATGDVAAANDPATVKAVKAASGSPDDLSNLVAKLSAGKV